MRPFMMQWNNEVLLISNLGTQGCNYSVTKDAFHTIIRDQLDELEILVQQDVLFGISHRVNWHTVQVDRVHGYGD